MKEDDLCILAPEDMHAAAVEDENMIVINIMMSRQHSFLAIMKIILERC